MKCPFRKITVSNSDKKIEEFADCYERSCPYFSEGDTYTGLHYKSCEQIQTSCVIEDECV